MNIELVVSGGFAGLAQTPVRVETESLDPATRDRVESLVRAVPWPELEDRSPIRGSGADRFQYRITIDDGGDRHSVIASEDALPVELQPLAGWLRRRGETAPS